MKISLPTNKLRSAVETIAPTASKQDSTVPGIKIDVGDDAMVMTSTDGVQSATCRVEVSATGTGTFGIPADPLRMALKYVDAEVTTVEVGDGGRVELLFGSDLLVLNSMPVEAFPAIAFPEASGSVFDPTSLARALDKARVSASTDTSRMRLTGVQIQPVEGGVDVVATDSVRLAVCNVPGEFGLKKEDSFLIPASSVSTLVKMLKGQSEVQLLSDSTRFGFTSASSSIMTQQLEFEYPKYVNLIPTGEGLRHVDIDASALAGAADYVRSTTEATKRVVALAFQGDKLTVSADSTSIGESKRVIATKNFVGEDCTMHFGYEALLGGIRTLGSSTMRLSWTGPLKPVLMQDPTNTGIKYVVAPRREQ